MEMVPSSGRGPSFFSGFWNLTFFLFPARFQKNGGKGPTGPPNSSKVADFSKPMMALFDNLIAADLKKGNDMMFIMVSISCFQVAT
jgi:hypothetical protein